MKRIFLVRTFLSVVAATGILMAPAVAQKEKDPVVVTGAVAVTNTVDVNVVSPDSNGGGVDLSTVKNMHCDTPTVNIPSPVTTSCNAQITVNAQALLNSVFISSIGNLPESQGGRVCRARLIINRGAIGNVVLAEIGGSFSGENTHILFPNPISIDVGDIFRLEAEMLFVTNTSQTCRGFVSIFLEQ